MTQTQARYDEFADWYEQWSSDMPPLLAAEGGPLPAMAGDRVLDIACGQGRLSRRLAARGADVTGVDISDAMLDRARASGPASIAYLHGDVTSAPSAWWDGRPFDGVTCEMALMDIDDLTGTLSAAAAVLRPGGWFAASVSHPCLPGSERGLSSWPPDQGYDAEGFWTSPADHNPNGVRIRVGASHRKLSTYLNALLEAGLEPELFLEPPAPIPTYLLWRCRRR
jgi:SAM-dependent methyltransferase